MPTQPALPALLTCAALALSGCVVTSTSQGGSVSTAGRDAQLRASVDGPLRRAGVSDECINSLDTDALIHVVNLTQRSPSSSREVLLQRQQLRTFVGRYCPQL